MGRQEMQSVLARLREMQALDRSDAAAARRRFDELLAAYREPGTCRTEAGELAGLPCLTHTPPEALPGAAILFFHGGGFSAGSPESHADLCGRLATASGLTVCCPAYRLAPEHPYPAAHQDCLAAYRAVIAERASTRTVVAGISTGATLALSTLVAARDAKLPPAGAGLLLSPLPDLSFASLGEPAGPQAGPKPDDWLTPDFLEESAKAYLGGADPRGPGVSPLCAALTELPPVFVQIGMKELLLPDVMTLDRKLRGASNSASLEVWPQMAHAFQLFAGAIDEARRAVDSAGRFARQTVDY